MGIAVYCVNVTKKSVEKRASMLTHRELSIAKSKLKIHILKINYMVLCAKKFLFKYSLDSHEQRTVEDLKSKQIKLTI